jgi:hypothetical protein
MTVSELAHNIGVLTVGGTEVKRLLDFTLLLQGERGGGMSQFVREEFEATLSCGRWEHGFIRA